MHDLTRHIHCSASRLVLLFLLLCFCAIPLQALELTACIAASIQCPLTWREEIPDCAYDIPTWSGCSGRGGCAFA